MADVGGAGTRSLALRVLPGTLAVCRLAPGANVPRWALEAAAPTSSDAPSAVPLFALTRTAEELSIVCEEAIVPADVRCERGWRALGLIGPFEFDLTGILAAIANPLASAGIGIFALSTFDTDYVLVKERDLDTACRALQQAGHRFVE